MSGRCAFESECESRGVPPLLCPECGEPLDTIHIEEHNRYYWDEAEGSYDLDDHTSGTILCPNCGEPIGGYGQKTWGFNPDFG